MSVALVFAFGAVLFAIFSFTTVAVITVLRERASAREAAPTGLARRSANLALQQVAKPRRRHEGWFDFVWSRGWLAVQAYVQCKRRTAPGTLDLVIVVTLVGAATLSWLDILDTLLEVWLKPRDGAAGETAAP
ncbi:MAG: hypothetical protein AAFX85_09065 [Pseudomonadota bacterium]